MPRTARVCIRGLVVTLAPPAVTIVRTPELHQSGYRDPRPGGIVRSQVGLPVRDLKPTVTYRLAPEYRGQGADQRMVLGKRAAARTGVRPSRGVEPVSGFGIVREGVAQPPPLGP